MYLQATISCECGCVSRFEFQGKAGKDTYICPQCGRGMDKTAYQGLTDTMAELIDWNMDMSKNAEGLHEPKMRAIALTMADMP